ncbi:MAG TPA: branched-chain amino acid ABC transporter substrate-binding protein [Bacillota bacterium]|nr:branched-chain amino acid ABC transporter substrate-binding protein [Bacillota bacterium]HPL53444.1 branched-chain amino acid ABC transporter substrate-binding protein [Bacillota bacterium]
MAKRLWILAFVVVLIASGVVGCSQPAAPPSGGEENKGASEAPKFDGEILLGIMVPVTGSEATYGKDMENAIKIAAEEINAAGGVLGKELKFTLGDDGCDPQMCTAAASKLVSSEVVAVLGGYCSGATIPALKIYGDAKKPFVILAANSTQLIDENPGWAFMINSPGYHQADAAANCFENLKVNKLALVHQGDGFSENLAQLTKVEWEKRGHSVVAYDVVNKGEQDFSSLVTKIKSSGAEGVYWTAYHADGALLIKQLRQGGYTGEITVADGSSSVQLLEIAGAAGEGVYCTSPPVVDFLPAAKQFISAYHAKHNQEPGPYAGLAYDGTYLLVDAIKRAGSIDPDAIKNALSATDKFQTLSGTVTFTPQNVLEESNFITIKGEGGKWVLVE